MFSFSQRLFLGSVCACAVAMMSGCGAGSLFPNVAPMASTGDEVRVGTIQGSNYGGHAPIVGSHIYLLQPGTGGYGSVTKGLLTAGYAGSYPTTMNPTSGGDQFVPASDSAGNPYYYETADSSGSFNLTGDYTCTVGQPVFIVGYGGDPSYVGGGPNTFSVSTEETYNDGSAGVYLTYTTSSAELFYVGEQVTIAGNPGSTAGFNQTGTVLGSGFNYDGSAAPLTTTQFSIYVPYNSTLTSATGDYPFAAYGGSGVTVTGTPTFNPAIVNIAMLGICPSSGNFSTGSSALSYVYMNEISTTAFAYAMNQYANWSVNDQSGNDEFHIGAPNTVQAQVGIQNAALNAANLYDIQGRTGVSTVFAGEGHLARTTTASGTGTVPQATLDTLGNILAACVDSNNTYRLHVGTVSPQCNSLETYATDNGVYDSTVNIHTGTYTHVAFNIAQAAMNIAHYPQGAGTGTTSGGVQTVTAGTATSARTFTTGLFSIRTGNVPFTPNLSAAPNDFAIAIQWNIGATANDVQIDKNGNAFAAAGASGMYQIAPSGTVTAYTAPLSTSNGKNLGSVAIDGVNGNIWATGNTGVYEFAIGTTAGTLIGASNGLLGTGIALDSSLNQYWGSGGAQGTGSSIVKQNAAGLSAGANYPILSGTTANSAGICAQAVGYVALDKSGNMWTGTADDIFNGNPYVCRFDALGNLQYSLAVPTNIPNQAGTFGYPHGMGTDSSDNAFFPDKNSDRIYKVAQGTTTNNSGYTYLELHGQLSAPKGLAVDGANTIWISNTGDLPATTGAKYATGLVQFSSTPALLTPNYITGAAYSTQPTTSLGSVAIDPSGDVWSAQAQIYQGPTPTLVYEYIGLAAPTVTPIAAAKAGGTVGIRP